MAALARRLALSLSRWADRRDPIFKPRHQFIRAGELHKLPNVWRLDFDALRDGRVLVRYCALDPIWRDGDEAATMVNLREHVTRLCMVANELAAGDPSGSWWPVSENLLLAASLTDLSADTDLQNSSMMCRPAAEYEDANSQLAEKHLAGVIVSTLVWTAFECAVEAVSSGSERKPKGALGRDILSATFGDGRFPHLKSTVMNAIGAAPNPPSFTSKEAQRLLARGAWAAIGAEHLRQFRNSMVHGQMRKPEPQDWGERSSYVIDQDPAIKQFETNIRLMLILIQILAHVHVDPAHVVLSQLHCIVEQEECDQLPLPMLDAPLRTPDDHY